MTRMTRTHRRRAAAVATGVFLLAGLARPLAARAAEGAAEPQLLDYGPSAIVSAVWVLLIFVAVLFILAKPWKNVLAGLTAREQRIRRDIADAEGARVKAEASLVEYNKQLATAETQVRELLARATADAERIAANIQAKAQAESEEMKARAVKEIDTSRQQALSDIYEQTANLATSVAEKILRRNLNADDQKDLVSRSLDQLQNV